MAVETIIIGTSDDGMRLDRWFKTYYNVPFVQVQKKCRKGEIRLNGKRVKGREILQTGMCVRVPPLAPVSVSPSPKAYNADDAHFIRDMVIYQDDRIIALNKPAGLAVQGGANTPRHIDGLSRYLHRDSQEKPRLVHRLDKDTSGVLLLGRSRQSASYVTHMFKSHTPRKVYWAIVVGDVHMDAGTIDAPIAKHNKNGVEKMYVSDDGKRAVTDFQVLERMGDALSLVALWPRTGRTHQLRVHMAHMGTPILGDGKYGGKAAFVSGESHMKKMHLHARSITVDDITITADVSDTFLATCNMFGVDILPAYDGVWCDTCV